MSCGVLETKVEGTADIIEHDPFPVVCLIYYCTQTMVSNGIINGVQSLPCRAVRHAGQCDEKMVTSIDRNGCYVDQRDVAEDVGAEVQSLRCCVIRQMV